MQTLTTIKQVMQEVTQRMDKSLESTRKEFQNLRTGRASIHLVEGILVNYYNTPTPLKAIAQVSTPDAKTILIQPWDQSAIAEIEKAIQASDIGVMPENDGKVIRLRIPPLTEERRGELSKFVKKVAEEGRISIRNARHEANEAAKRMEKEKLVTQDDSQKAQKEIQKLTDKHIELVEQSLAKKEAEIKEI